MKAWEHFLAVQEASLGKDVVDTWLRPLKIVRFDAGNLYLEANDSFQVMWFEEHVRPTLKDNFYNPNNRPIKVHIGTLQDGFSKKVSKKPTGRDKKNEPSTPAFEVTFDLPDPLCTLENFVPCESNQLAYKLLIDLVSQNEHIKLGTFNPIFLYGHSGSGKSHLLAALCHKLTAQGLRVTYARADTFTEHVVQAIRSGEMHIFRQAYRNTDVLMLDDVHVFARKAATQEELFHTFNTLHMAGKQIFLSANCPPSELQNIEPRLISRFEWGIVLEVGTLPSNMHHLLLQKKCEAIDFPLNGKIVDYLVENFKSNPKALTKALEALVLRTHLNRNSGNTLFSSTAITLQQVKHYLADLTQIEQQETITPQKILKCVAEYYGIKIEDITGKAQSRDCSFPRQIAVYLCRDLLKLPYKKIGEIFDRDHSTIMTSIKQIQKLIEANAQECIGPLKAIQNALRKPAESTVNQHEEMLV